jgi:hypothetical protein
LEARLVASSLRIALPVYSHEEHYTAGWRVHMYNPNGKPVCPIYKHCQKWGVFRLKKTAHENLWSADPIPVDFTSAKKTSTNGYRRKIEIVPASKILRNPLDVEGVHFPIVV